MWALTNQTPFAAERAFVRDRDGAEIWLIAIRGTFKLMRDGQVSIAEEQAPVVMAPKYEGDPSSTPLLHESDLVRTKLATDVIVLGSACAPVGKMVEQLTVRLQLGPIDKQIVVRGTTVIREGTFGTRQSSTPELFERLPISYSRAYGGVGPEQEGKAPRWERRNPIGVGMDIRVGQALPSQHYPPEQPSPGRAITPASFGPIPASWEPRVSFAGTYDDRWKRERQPLVPSDFDDRYFQSAPADQQVPGFLRGGEEVTLTHFTPGGILRFALPRHSFGFRTRIAGATTHHRASLHTVIIEPDERRLTMVWHTSLPCHHTLYTLKETTVFEKRRLERSMAHAGVGEEDES
jgi:hypothetical protein